MKRQIVISADADDIDDVRDMKTIADASARARAGFGYEGAPTDPRGLINHLTRTPGVFISRKQIAEAIEAFEYGRRYFEQRNKSNSVLPDDERRAIVAAIDDALEVLNRWDGKFSKTL